MELRRALAGGQIQAWAQPVVSLTDGRIHGVELLARWTLRDGTVVSPAVFVSLAEEVGLEFGKQMAASMGPGTDSQRSFRSALHVVADALSSHGFAAHAERHGDELRIVSSHCPFGDVAIEHPVICAVDRGMVKGLLGSLYGETQVALSSSVAKGDDSCVADVTDIGDDGIVAGRERREQSPLPTA